MAKGNQMMFLNEHSYAGVFTIYCMKFKLYGLTKPGINNHYMVFTPHVPVYFWPNRHNVGDIELKFCIFP